MQKLMSYFTDGITSQTLHTIGAEIETQFVDRKGKATETQVSQQMLRFLADKEWKVEGLKGNLITALVDRDGNKIFYELGRHNMEVSTKVSTQTGVLEVAQKCLNQLYKAGSAFGAEPYFAPILYGEEDLLVIPDERDAVWLDLDGRQALAPLARTSSVQFTISVSPQEATWVLNKLGARINLFLADYPQDRVWKRYIKESSAGYLPSRYGGPLQFDSLTDYCGTLMKHKVVVGTGLVPFSEVNNLDVPLFLRSIWWHFRLKRYGTNLCVEVRPMARSEDSLFQDQLDRVVEVVCN